MWHRLQADMALNASGGTPVSLAAFAFFSFLTALEISSQVMGFFELPQCPLLCDMFDKTWIKWLVIVVDMLKVWSKDRHIFRGICCTGSVR